MERLLGLLLAALLAVSLVACSDDPGPGPDREDVQGQDQEPPTGADSPTDRPVTPGDVVFTEVALLSESAAGGEVSSEPVRLDTAAAVSAFTGQFTGRTLTQDIEAAVSSAKPADDQVLVGAVVALGCETPQGVSVSRGRDGLVISPAGMPKSTVQCLVPVTSVGIVAVDASEVR